MSIVLTDEQKQMVSTIRDFVARDVIPYASDLEHADEYPTEMVEKVKEMGLFGAFVPKEYGGLGLDNVTFVLIIEELCKGWMSLSGTLGSHSIMTSVIANFGTDDQKERFLPAIARGEKRGGVGLTEPEGGSDLQAIQTRAVKDGDDYIINGAKMFVTNGIHGNTFALLVKTDMNTTPAYKGISCFIIEKGGPGLIVGNKIKKLGYRGIDTTEFAFEDFRVPATNLVGGVEGQGFRQIMSGLEGGRINVAARAVGVAQAAFEAAIAYAQGRVTFGKPIAQHQAIQLKLADMATKIEAARLLT
ncbi:MAG: acyl-CoA dehydrogenase family protein, partial [Chloroflexi bacterium]|nr:acyl-CoA dehydrogenase family protein [Chloroflexota bacterium]